MAELPEHLSRLWGPSVTARWARGSAMPTHVKAAHRLLPAGAPGGDARGRGLAAEPAGPLLVLPQAPPAPAEQPRRRDPRDRVSGDVADAPRSRPRPAVPRASLPLCLTRRWLFLSCCLQRWLSPLVQSLAGATVSPHPARWEATGL